MRIEELMTHAVHGCDAEDDLATAVALMAEHDLGFLPILGRGGRVVGVLTDRDVCLGALRLGKAYPEIPVMEVATREVISCSPDDALGFAERLMQENRVRRLPVVDRNGALVGVIAQTDLAREAVHEEGSRRPEVTPEEVLATIAATGTPGRGRIVPA
jgi:CBS domain-containing protein